MEGAVSARWHHLNQQSDNEAAEAEAGGDTWVQVHPLPIVMQQFRIFWDKQEEKDHKERMLAQGAGPPAKQVESSKRHLEAMGEPRRHFPKSDEPKKRAAKKKPKPWVWP